MSDFKPGLEGVVAFETEIAEPDKEGGSLRYRGVDIEELVGQVSFGQIWGLLVDNAFNPGLPPAGLELLPVRTGDVRVDVQSGTAALAAAWGLRPLFDIDPAQARADVGRVCAAMLSFIAQSARGSDRPAVPSRIRLMTPRSALRRSQPRNRYVGRRRVRLRIVRPRCCLTTPP